MRPIVSSLALVAALAMAHTAAAQSDASAVDYCRTLARAYLSQNPVQATPNVNDATLADSCTGDTPSATTALKRKLADHGIDLPKPAIAGGDGMAHPVQ